MNSKTAAATPASHRLQKLTQWLDSLPPDLALAPNTMVPASSDASFRRYFRLQAGKQSLIVMDAPPPQENCAPFVDVTMRLTEAGVTVPKILACDLGNGFMLLSDLGHHTYYDRIQAGLEDTELQTLYREALGTLVKLQHGKHDGLLTFDAPRLVTELQLFPEWFIKTHHNTDLTKTESEHLDRIFVLLAQAMASEPRVLVHRDFHSPNLMVCDRETGLVNPGVLDYQDAVAGPISYDIASLVFDARTTWDEPQQLDWAIRYWEKAKAARLPVPTDFAVFHQQYEWASLQRNLRILGVFARLNHRDNKAHYLAHVPRVLQYVRQVAARYQPFVPLMRLLDRLQGIEPEVKLTF
ncbi:MAG: phosphotransferase [Burkholderiaceae bacterium]|nr:phosphotransferase [Burkholderiaceae bacterium]